MSEEVETKEVVYHVLSELAKHGIFEVREGGIEDVEKRRLQEAKNVTLAGKLVYKELSEHMNSKCGAYELSATVVACLGAGWVAAHADELKKEDLDVRRKEDLNMDLFNISNAVILEARKEKQSDPKDIKEAIGLGTSAGTRLGERILYATPHTRMSSRKMLEILADLNKIPNFSPSLARVRHEGR